MSLGLGNKLARAGLVVPGIVTSGLTSKLTFSVNTLHELSSTADRDGGSVFFDGTDDYIDCDNKPIIQIGNADATYMAWIKTSVGSSYIIAKRDGSNGALSLQLDSAGKLKAYLGTQAALAASETAVHDGLWHHVAFVHDQSDTSGIYYVDGNFDGTTDLSSSTFDDNSDVYIGFRESGDAAHYFQGYMANVSIWDAAMAPDKVRNLAFRSYGQLKDADKTRLIAYWILSYNAEDSTANQNHGTLT